MHSSPRFTRGTSIIAALVFAALLGAIALGLNAFQSNSVNTTALPADPTAAAAATSGTSEDQVQCKAGHVYYIAKQSQDEGQTTYDVDPSQIFASPSPGNGTVRISNFMYPDPSYGLDKQVVVGDATVDACNYSMTTNGESGATGCSLAVGNLLGTADSKCISTYVVSYEGQSETAQASCPTTSSKGTGVEIYVKNSTIQVQACQAGTNLQSTSPTNSSLSSPSSTSSQVPATTVSPATGLGETCVDSSTCGAGLVCINNECQLSALGGNTNQCGELGSDPATCSLSTSVPVNCTQNGQTFSCTGSNQSQADSLQDNLEETTNGNYVCNYNQASGQTTCSVDNTPDTTNVNTPANMPNPTPTAPTTLTKPTGNNNNALSGLTSFISGLTRGLTPCTTSPYQQYQNPYVGGNGTTLVPVQTLNSNGTYSTVYVQQQTSPYGATPYGTPYGTSPCSPTQSAPYGMGTNGVACTVPPTQPQCAAGATAEPLSASGNGCVTGYQCVPTSSTLGQTPTPSLSCSPQVADVGQSVAISYSCTNATGSSASGFSTNNQTSGTASVTMQAPPSGTNTANFGLTCTNNGQNASAQCSVQIDQPAIDLVADPQSVQSGATASVGWVTAGMQSCVISSPDDSNFTAANANNTSPNGVAQTDAITGDTKFVLTCTTLGGQTKTASTVVTTSSSATSSAADLSVSSSADGATLNHGGSATITWSAASSTSAAAAIWLIDLNTEEATALIAGNQPESGSYTWQVPAAGSTCATTSYNVCASDLVAGDSYGIEVALYTPADAYLGPASSAPANAVSPTYTDYGYTANPFTVGQ